MLGKLTLELKRGTDLLRETTSRLVNRDARSGRLTNPERESLDAIATKTVL